MSEYLFVPGRTSELCQAEIEAVLSRNKIIYKLIFSSPEIFHIFTPNLLDANLLIHVLGGTIKIAEVVEFVEDRDDDVIIDKLTTLLRRNIKDLQRKRVVFGLSGYNGICFNVLKQWSTKVKQKLEEFDLNARFVLPSRGVVLASVVVSKQKLTEIILVKENNKIVLARTLVVQDFEDWGKRDFGRPAPDPHKGMLPPKVARMMVNIGMSNIKTQMSNVTILDPFCGVGTILGEGLMLGLNVIGSDQSQEAIEKTRKNLEWLKSVYRLPSTAYSLIESEATHVSQKLSHGSIDAIVSEPYLGPVLADSRWQMADRELKNIILGLEKLYLGCFRDWWKILKPQGRIVIALPSFRLDKREFFVKKPLDTCENFGYTLVAGPYQYSRPQATVIRNIYILEKK